MANDELINPPAFPQPLIETRDGAFEHPQDENCGMTLRDYFAAHAPAEKWKHYHPQMPERPEPDWGDIPQSHRADVDPLNWVAIEQWKCDESREYELQWPYFYADAMLRKRVK